MRRIKSLNKIICIVVYLLLFLTPFCYPFRPIISRYLPIHVYISMYLTIFALCFIGFLKRRSILATKIILGIFILYIVSLPFSPDLKLGLKWIVNFGCGIMLANLFLCCKFGEWDWLPFVLGAIVCGIIMQPDIIVKFPVSLLYCHEVRTPFMDGDVSIGPNSWGFTLSLCFLWTVLMVHRCDKKKGVLFLIVALIVITWQLVLTKSRSAVYSLIVCVLVILHKWVRERRKYFFFKVIHMFLIMGVIGIFLLILFDSGLIFSGQSRLTDLDLNGRITIWRVSLNTLLSMNPLQWILGCGTGGGSVYNNIVSNDYFRMIETQFSVPHDMDHISTHNIYLDLLISTGLLGTCVTLLYFVCVLIKMFKEPGCWEFMFPLYFLSCGLVGNLLGDWDTCLIIAVMEYYCIRKCGSNEMVKITWGLYREIKPKQLR